MSVLWADPIFGILARELYGRYGLVFEGGQCHLFKKRIARRSEDLGYASPSEYLRQFIDKKSEEEFENLVELLTVNETYFFREVEHYNVLLETFWPKWTQKGDKVIRVWSAACSKGCEAYTLAMMLLEKGMVGPGRPKVEILATDVNRRVIEEARRGVYGEFALRSTSSYYRKKYFEKKTDGYHLSDSVLKMISFRKFNLLTTEEFGPRQAYNVVFCRNVLIYFDQKAKRRVVASIENSIKPGGIMLIGRSESLFGVPEAPQLISFGDVMVHVKAD